jgi:hypothetical protein
LWSFVFEPQTQETQTSIQTEVQRVAGGDPRIFVSQVDVYPQENGILLEIQLTVVPTTDAKILSIFFDQQQRTASYV